VGRRILVTGAGGFVGRHLLQLLAREDPGDRLYAWYRPGTRAPTFSLGTDARDREEAVPVTWSGVDILDRHGVAAALIDASPDHVYHLAGRANVARSWADPAGALEVNVAGTHVLLEQLWRHRIAARVLIPSSGTVYAPSGDPLTEDAPVAPASPYALSKLAQEMLGQRVVADDGQDVVIVRAFNHVGPGQDPSYFAPAFARQLAAIEGGTAPRVLRVGNLDAQRDLTDVRDTVQAYRLLLERGTAGRVYNVCTGVARRVGDVLDRLIANCRVEVRVEVDAALLRPNDVPRVLGSFARLQAETGWTPQIPLDRTLADLLAAERLKVEERSDPRPTPIIEG
jgi:GDP-4-dehydro-6-deoxy-D-mannose reductase